MQVTIVTSGLIEKNLGWSEKKIVVSEEATVAEALQQLELSFNVSWLFITIENKRVSMNRSLSSGDKIRVLPICGGG